MLRMQFRRHPMHLTAVQQYAAAFRCIGGLVDPALLELVKTHASGIRGSHLEEDKFKVQKVDKELVGTKGIKPAEASFTKVMKMQVVSERHHYKPVEICTGGLSVGDQLDKSHYHAAL